MRGLPRYIAIRIGTGFLALLVVTLIIQFSVELLPGDLATAVYGQNATPENTAALRAKLGLDLPPMDQYLQWLGLQPGWARVDAAQCVATGRGAFEAAWINDGVLRDLYRLTGETHPGRFCGLVHGRCVAGTVSIAEASWIPGDALTGIRAAYLGEIGGRYCGAFQGDFGVSLLSDKPVTELMGDRLYNTFFLAGLAALMAVPLALTLGILAALYRRSWFDRIVNVTTLTSISSPEFFVGYTLMLFLVHMAGIFEPLSDIKAGMPLEERIYYTMMPALTLMLVIVAHMMRMTRASIINLLASPYIEMARLKGVSASRVILVHALPNALAPIINVIALNLAYLITGVVVVEVVFTYQGVGQLLVDNVSKRDMPVVQACCLIFAATYILLNLLADVLSILSNPRLRQPR